MRRAVFLGLLLALPLLLLVPRDQSLRAEGPERVVVTNFPEVQRVSGSVQVPFIPQTRLESFSALVSPASLAETGSYTEAGILDAAGFATVTLSLAGNVQGRLVAAAPIGVVLLPDVPEIVAAFRTHGVAQFALEVDAQASPSESGIFQSAPAHFPLGFPRYRVFFYNGTPRTSEVTLYAYLKSS